MAFLRFSAAMPASRRSLPESDLRAPAGRTGWWKTTLSSPSVSAPVTLRLGRGSAASTSASQPTATSPLERCSRTPVMRCAADDRQSRCRVDAFVSPQRALGDADDPGSERAGTLWPPVGATARRRGSPRCPRAAPRFGAGARPLWPHARRRGDRRRCTGSRRSPGAGRRPRSVVCRRVLKAGGGGDCQSGAVEPHRGLAQLQPHAA